MGALAVDVDPGEVGFDAERLQRIDRHFARHVDDGVLPGWLFVLTRAGRVVHLSAYGEREPSGGVAVDVDTLWRIYSMTKPITSVAAMMLYEEGAFELRDPVSRFIPSFADVRVYVEGPSYAPVTRPAVEPMRIWHLLTHTAGLTYDILDVHAVDSAYRKAGIRGLPSRTDDVDLATVCDRLAQLPLLFDPGSEWNYSLATDVLGRVVEVAAGIPLDEFFEERIFGPLGMSETRFWVPDADLPRLAALCTTDAETGKVRAGGAAEFVRGARPRYLSGGAGLVSTAPDYHRFTQLLLRHGELDGVRLLGSRTVDFMSCNHLPGGADLASFGRPHSPGTFYEGVGFGLGFAVLDDPVANRLLASPGLYRWGGIAGTDFWVDPAEEITALFFTQLIPHPPEIRTQLRRLVYQALVD